MKITIIDPPSGWLYGFPKEDTRPDNQTPEEWFLEQGYPQRLIDQGMLNHCRFWEKDVKDEA